MEDILRSVLGAEDAEQSTDAAAGQSTSDPLSGMLESLLGGSGTEQAATTGQGGLGDILGAILGGGTGQQASGTSTGTGGLNDILGAILGGGATQQTSGAGTSAIVDGVASKLGLPSGIAQMIVAFVIGKLLSGLSSSAAQAQSSYSSSGTGRQVDSSQIPNFDGLLQQMSGDTGMAHELAKQTGLDTRTAKQGIQHVLGMFGSQAQNVQAGQASSGSQQGGLDNLLQNW